MKTLYLTSFKYSIFPEEASIETTSYKMVVLKDATGIPEHAPDSSFVYYQRAMVEDLVRGWIKTMLPNARIITVEPALFVVSGDIEIPEEALSATIFETVEAKRERLLARRARKKGKEKGAE